MRIPYSPVDEGDNDDTIESLGSIQTGGAIGPHGNHRPDEEMFCPSRPLLKQWPMWPGVCQLIVGFVCAILGLVEVLVLPFIAKSSARWYFGELNSYGAVLWSGVMLVLSGSSAVRAAITKRLLCIQVFFIVNFFALLFNFSMLALILTYSRHVQVGTWVWSDVDAVKIYVKYLAVPTVGSVFCVVGIMLLAVTVARHFKDVMCGQVQLLKSLGRCCCPCCCNGPPSEASSRQSVNSNDSNMIV